jgi:predicted Zn-dependent peptidase
MAVHFVDHPLARSVLGTTDSVSKLTAEQMRAYFDRRYSPKNMTLVAAGKVDFAQLIKQAERWCGGWQPFAAEREVARAPERRAFKVFTHEAATQEYCIVLINGPAATDEDRYAGRILATVLGDDSGSRLYWELIDTGLAECAVMGSYEYQGTGLFMAYLGCMPEDAAANLQRIHDVFRKVESEGITEKELLQAQNKICSHVVRQAERPSSRLFSVGNGWVQRREYRTVAQAAAAYRAVTVDEVNALLKKYPLTINTTVCVGPLTELDPPK